MSKESSRVNAQLVPRFEKRTPYHQLGVHFWERWIWTWIFGSKFQKENFGKNFREKWILSQSSGGCVLASGSGRVLCFDHWLITQFSFPIFFMPLIVEIKFSRYCGMILSFSCLNLMIFVLYLICMLRLKEK